MEQRYDYLQVQPGRLTTTTLPNGVQTVIAYENSHDWISETAQPDYTSRGYPAAVFLANPDELLFGPLLILNWRRRRGSKGPTRYS